MNTHTQTHIKHTPPLLHCLSAVSHDLTASSRCRLLLLVFPFTPHLLTDFLSPLSLRYYTVLNLCSSFKCIFAVLVQFSQLMTSHLRLPFPESSLILYSFCLIISSAHLPPTIFGFFTFLFPITSSPLSVHPPRT